MNNINFTISQVSCDKIAGIAKYIPSADASIFHFKYKETEETKISRDYGAFGITGSYKKGTGLNLSIGINDDLIDLGVNAMYTFVPAICGAVCSLAGHVGRLKKLLKINNDEPVRVKHGDKIKVIYTIGRNTTSKVITCGLAEMGENIDLSGMSCGQVYRTNIDVMGTKMPITIMVDKIIMRGDDAKPQIGESDDTKKICGGMRLPDEVDNTNTNNEVKPQIGESDEVDNTNIDNEAKLQIGKSDEVDNAKIDDAKELNHMGGNPAVRFSCYENSNDNIGDNHIVNVVRNLRDDARDSGMSAEEFFGDTAAKDLDVKG